MKKQILAVTGEGTPAGFSFNDRIYTVETVPSIENAIEVLYTRTPDIVALDSGLPEENISRLRSIVNLHFPDVMVVTAATDELFNRAKEALHLQLVAGYKVNDGLFTVIP